MQANDSGQMQIDSSSQPMGGAAIDSRENQALAKVLYFCGQCGKKNELVLGNQEIKCSNCQGRIFYKVRQRQPLQYEAR